MALTVAGWHVGWLLLLVDALAVARLARLVTTDSLLHRPRAALLRRWPPRPGHPVELAVCSWCVSFWLAIIVLALTLYARAWWTPAAVVLAWSEIAGYLAERT